MKKIKFTIASFTVLLTAAVFMSFTAPPENNGNGNIVTVDFVNYYWVADNCDAPAFFIENVSRRQIGSNGHVNITGSFYLPEGHCDIPANGATTIRYDNGSRAVINSKGKVNFKYNFRPNN